MLVSVYLLTLMAVLCGRSFEQQILTTNTSTTTDDSSPYTLILFTTATYTGYEPRDGKVCAAAMQVAVNTINDRTDKLQDYNIKLVIRDEGPTGVMAPRQFLRFWDDTTAVTQSDPTMFMAPAIIGTTQGCDTITGLSRQFKMVQFTPGCSGNSFTANRKKFPYLYRNRIRAEVQHMPAFVYASRETKWRQMAIITLYSNSNDYMNAKGICNDWISNGPGNQVVFFTGVTDVTMALIDEIRQSDARVIYFATGGVNQFMQMICLAYQGGIRGSTYAFMTGSTNFNDPNASDLALPAGCTQQMYIEQVKITLWTGAFDFALENQGISSFGFDMVGFDTRLDKLTNNSRSADYVRRHRCFDAMGLALLSLDAGEKMLKSTRNLSLRDFTTHPSTVLKAVNLAAAQTDFVGVRVGKLKYNDILELDNEVQYLVQWVNGELRIIYRAWFTSKDASLIHNISMYSHEKVKPVKWYTGDGSPPKDLSDVQRRWESFDDAVFWVIVALAFLLSTLTLAFPWTAWKLRKPVLRQKVLMGANAVTIFGCIVSNLASITLGLKIETSPTIICTAQVVMVVMGVAFMTGMIFFRLALLYRSGSNSRGQTPLRIGGLRMTPRLQRSAINKSHEVMKIRHGQPLPEKRIIIATFLFVSVNAAFVVIWLGGVNPVSALKVTSRISFDPLADSYFRTTRSYCTSNHFPIWMGALAALNFLLLLAGALMSYESRQVVVEDSETKMEFIAVRVAAVNAATVFAACTLLLFVYPEASVTFQPAVIAFGLLILGNSTAIICLIPAIIFYLRTNSSVGSSSFDMQN